MKIRFCAPVVLLLLGLLFILFGFSAVETWLSGYGWHNQQRIFQLLLILVTALLAVFLPQQALPPLVRYILASVLVMGYCSAWLSDWPEWAYKEWARYVGLVILVLLLGALAQQRKLSCFLLWVMAFIGFIHAFQFLVSYLAAFISGIGMLDANVLFSGFINPRFFGQFQVMLLPVLALLAVQSRQHQHGKVTLLLLAVLITQWCIAFTLDGRGLWLGLLLSHGAVMVINRHLWRVVALQVITALLGFVLYLLLFHLLPFLLGLDPVLRDGLRTSLSGRELIWQWAYNMALANPWLGVGPMHYAAVINPIAAHPHQVILQWLAEWGFVATGLALILGVWGMAKGAAFLRSPVANELDVGLWAAIVGALVLAQVDGVFVMPYTETWLALLIGLALGRWSIPVPAPRSQRIACAVLSVPVVLILGQVLIKEVPNLPRAEEAYLQQNHTGWKPRFWQQGWIPMKID